MKKQPILNWLIPLIAILALVAAGVEELKAALAQFQWIGATMGEGERPRARCRRPGTSYEIHVAERLLIRPQPLTIPASYLLVS